jgi:hypothetical protein
MGQLRLRFNKWWMRYYVNGRRIEESSGTDKKHEATRIMKEREGAVAKGETVDPRARRITFDQAAADVVTDYRTNGKRSIKDAERRIKLHLTPFFGHRRMANINGARASRSVQR